MDIKELTYLRDEHAALRLLRATHFAFIAAFFWRQFTTKHLRVIDEDTLRSALDDDRYALPEDPLTGPSLKYLKEWVEAGYLRQYYVEQDDIPRYELTPATEKLIDWLRGLRRRDFIGTESRLKTIFDLMRDLREQTEADIERRVKLLQSQRDQIDKEIERALRGEIETLTGTQIKERFAQLEEMGRHLLRDFSEVEQNFRDLDRSIRTRIAKTEGSRGDVIAAVFTESDHIAESEQGRSFAAFFEFLMSGDRRDELEDLLSYIYGLTPVKEGEPDSFLMKIQSGLLDASTKAMATRNRLAAQLRRFLDDRLRHENTRILRLIHTLEADLLSLRNEDDIQDLGTVLDELKITVDVPVKGLYRVPLSLKRADKIEKASAKAVAADALFAVEQIDERRLMSQIRRCLEHESPVALEKIIARFPPEQGVSELIAYVKIASKDQRAQFQDDENFRVIVEKEGRRRAVTVPQVYFYR